MRVILAGSANGAAKKAGPKAGAPPPTLVHTVTAPTAPNKPSGRVSMPLLGRFLFMRKAAEAARGGKGKAAAVYKEASSTSQAHDGLPRHTLQHIVLPRATAYEQKHSSTTYMQQRRSAAAAQQRRAAASEEEEEET